MGNCQAVGSAYKLDEQYERSVMSFGGREQRVLYRQDAMVGSAKKKETLHLAVKHKTCRSNDMGVLVTDSLILIVATNVVVLKKHRSDRNVYTDLVMRQEGDGCIDITYQHKGHGTEEWTIRLCPSNPNELYSLLKERLPMVGITL